MVVWGRPARAAAGLASAERDGGGGLERVPGNRRHNVPVPLPRAGAGRSGAGLGLARRRSERKGARLDPAAPRGETEAGTRNSGEGGARAPPPGPAHWALGALFSPVARHVPGDECTCSREPGQGPPLSFLCSGSWQAPRQGGRRWASPGEGRAGGWNFLWKFPRPPELGDEGRACVRWCVSTDRTGTSRWGPFGAGRRLGYRGGALSSPSPPVRWGCGCCCYPFRGLGSGLLGVAWCVDTVFSEASTHVLTGQWVKIPGFGPSLCRWCLRGLSSGVCGFPWHRESL